MADNWDNGWSNNNGETNDQWDNGGAKNNDSFHNPDAAMSHNDDFGGNNDGNAGDINDGACRNCGQEGHFARDCPEPRKMGACFNCGEEGHSKAECTQPRVFTGECRVCNEKGHQARDCPTVPKQCQICQKEGHEAVDCTNNYNIDLNGTPDLTIAECWRLLDSASHEFDLDDFKHGLKCLQKASPEMTYPDLERKLRARNNKFFIIALEKDVSGAYTNVNLQGEKDKKYAVSFQKSEKASRPIMVAKWPKDPQDNLARLADAGETLPRGVPYCNNCEKFGHATRGCDQDFAPPEQVKIVCALCQQEGHRVRDCAEERQKPREPRTCKNCGSVDHLAKECDQPRKLICNNCEEEGHHSKDCDQPRDWSKVTCRHCGEKGHASAARCKPGSAKVDQDAGDENVETENGFNDDINAMSNASGGAGWKTDDAPVNGNEWEQSASTPVVATGTHW